MKNPSSPWISPLASWISSLWLTQLPLFVNIYLALAEKFCFCFSKKDYGTNVFWVIYYKIWHMCHPLLMTKQEVQSKQTTGLEDFHAQGGITQWDVPVKGSVGQGRPTGHDCCPLTIPTSLCQDTRKTYSYWLPVVEYSHVTILFNKL